MNALVSSLASPVLARMAARELRRLDETSRDPVGTQNSVLLRLVRRAADTEWGRSHDFSSIRDLAGFRERVPLRGYEDFGPLWNRSFDGERDLSWPGHIEYFALSSGTTSGNKLLPVSKDQLRTNQKSGWSVLALYLNQCPGADLLRGKVLYLGGSTDLRRRGKSFIGDASGIMTKFTPWPANRYRLPAPPIAQLTNWEQKIRAIVETTIGEDVRMVSGCPSWTVLLLEAIVEEGRRRGGKRIETVLDVWKNLKGFVHFGMAWRPYLPALRRLVGRDVVHVDTYSASEGGMLGVQDRQDRPDLRLLLDQGVFYEFIPESELAREAPTRLSLGEVETDETYEIVLSTNSGLWAYRLGDLVRFTSLDPPRVRMVGRTRLGLNAYGEHVIIEEMEEAVATACTELGAEFHEFTVYSHMPDATVERPHHEWLVEFVKEPRDPNRFVRRIDEVIRQHNEDYDTHRTDDYGLAPPRLRTVSPGTFYRWMERRGKLGGQHKVPRVLTEEKLWRELVSSEPGDSPRP